MVTGATRNEYYVSGDFIAGVRPFTIAGDTTVSMQNITIGLGNVVTNGGGIHNNGDLTLSATVLVLNAAGQEGGGLWDGASGTVTIEGGSQVEYNSANIANADNDAQGGGIHTTGGDTVTIVGSTIGSNRAGTLTHALTAASPAIDAAGDTSLSTDQRGIPRPQGGADDICAFELLRLFLPLLLQH